MKSRKAISPFIAVALLLAVTMTVGAFLAGWFHTYTESQTAQVEESAKAKCNFVTLNDKSQAYDSTHKLLTFQLENTGTADVKIEKVQIIYDDDDAFVTNFTVETLRAGELLAFKENYTDAGVLLRADIKSVRVVTECPEVSFTIDGDDITGAT